MFSTWNTLQDSVGTSTEQGLQDSKTSDLNGGTFSAKEAVNLCLDKVFTSFLAALSLP